MTTQVRAVAGEATTLIDARRAPAAHVTVCDTFVRVLLTTATTPALGARAPETTCADDVFGMRAGATGSAGTRRLAPNATQAHTVGVGAGAAVQAWGARRLALIDISAFAYDRAEAAVTGAVVSGRFGLSAHGVRLAWLATQPCCSHSTFTATTFPRGCTTAFV